MGLPTFRYHPDPVATGSVVDSGAVCECCERARGFVYTGPIYAANEIERLCPWCISDGSAASKLGAGFADIGFGVPEDVPVDVAREVSERTPSFTSWQQEHLALSLQRRCGLSRRRRAQGARAVSGRARGTPAGARRIQLVGSASGGVPRCTRSGRPADRVSLPLPALRSTPRVLRFHLRLRPRSHPPPTRANERPRGNGAGRRHLDSPPGLAAWTRHLEPHPGWGLVHPPPTIIVAARGRGPQDVLCNNL